MIALRAYMTVFVHRIDNNKDSIVHISRIMSKIMIKVYMIKENISIRAKGTIIVTYRSTKENKINKFSNYFDIASLLKLLNSTV